MTSDRIVLGTAALGTDSRDNAYRLLDAFVDLGGNTLDTATVYSDWQPGETGRSENSIGDWLALRGNRDRIRIVTKGAHPPLGQTNSRIDPVSVRHDVEQSLRRLRTDRLDHWLFHKDDGVSSIADVVGALQDLRREGKVLAFGSSNWTVARNAEALAIPGETFTGNQVLGNVFAPIMGTPGDPTNQIVDVPMFRQARDNGMTLYLFTSTAGGFFDRRAKGEAVPKPFDNPACAAAAEKLEAIAAEVGIDPTVMILAFLIHLGPFVRPVIGTNKVEHLRAQWKAHEVTLSPDTMRRIAAATGMDGFLN